MRNTNWTTIALALLAAAAVFYFMKQSDFMKSKVVAETEMATSMDLPSEDEPFEAEEMIGEPTDDEDEAIMVGEEELD